MSRFLKAALENLQAEQDRAVGTAEGTTAETTGQQTGEVVAPALSEEDLAVVETASDEEAEASAEAQELETAVEELSEELNEATDDVERIEEVAENLETASENGGMTPEAVRAVEVATESLLAKYDMSMKHAMPALESFSDVKTRSAQTHYAAEAFSDKAKELGAKVWNGIKAVIKWLQDLFAKYLTVAGRLEARAKKIKEAAGKAKDAKQQEVNFGGYLSKAKALAIDGKLPTDLTGAVEGVVARAYKATAIAAEIGRLIDNAGVILKDAGNTRVADAFNRSVEESQKQYADFFDKSAAAAGAEKGNVNAAKNGGFELPESDKHLLATEVLPGNKVIWGTRDENNVGLARFGIATKTQEFKTQKVKTLSIADIGKLADSAIQAAALKKSISDVEGKIKKMTFLVTDAAQKDAEGFRENFKVAVWSIRETLALAGAFHRPAVQVALATASAGLDLAQASLKVYGAAPEEAPKTEQKK